ncbi:MAG: hypothetical protein AAGD11_17715 [Planctomycetota bacterium]
MTRSLSIQSATRARSASWSISFRQSSAILTLAAFTSVAGVGSARADLVDEFLAGLRQRGWHDTALEYLDQADQDPIASASFRKNIDYERAVTQSALARQSPNERLRTEALLAAASTFQQFAQSAPDSPLQIQSLASAGNVFSELALYANNKAEKLPASANAQRKELYDSARKHLERARAPLTTLKEQCIAKLQALPKAAEAQKARSSLGNRQQLEGKLAEAKFLLAKLDFEKARTYSSESKAGKKVLQSAAKAFSKLYEEYEDKLVGFYGRFYQGRSYQVAGDIEKALECYLDIVDQPPIPNRDFRRLVARTHRYRAECHATGKNLDQVIKECSEWLQESSNQELAEPDWLAVSYQLAAAYEAKAEAASGKDAQRQRAEARKLFREIAKYPGEFQRDAKAKIAAGGSSRDKPVLVRNFAEAFDAGKESLEQMNSAKLAAKLARENNPDSVESLTEQALVEQAAAAGYFRQASRLADSTTDRDQLATARYYLCWLYWEAGRLDEAAVLGEFLARRYPENKYAPVAAKLALASYERLYNAAKQAGEPASFEAQQLAAVAELLVLRWPDSDEAKAGLNLLISIALRDNRLADAEQLLTRLPASSRAGAELRLGGALWTRYLRAANGAGEVGQLKPKAGKLLASGFEAIKAKPQVTAGEVTGVLYLAQFLLAVGEAGQAVDTLENSSVGPLSLVNAQSPVASRPEFVQETYKAALRAYLSTTPPQREKAQAMMTALEAAIGNDGNAEQKLISIYVSLGLQLQQQIRSLSADGQAEKARAVADSFADLLTRVTERAGAASSWKVQNWIAQTNLQLGQGLSGADAQRYFKQAADTYRALITKAEQNPKFAPSPVSLLAAKKQLADCQLSQGDFSAAFQQYALMLKSKPNMLELQQAAAAALQQWGTAEEESQRLEEAIRGAMPQSNRKNLVWGWIRISQIADQAKRKAAKKAGSDPKQKKRAEKYQDLFFEARLHAAEARFAAAKLANGADRTKQLNTARQSLDSMKRLYPDLGGQKWRQAYLDLIKQLGQEK